MIDRAGARVAILEARMSSELARLLVNAGAVPHSVPAVREVALDSDAAVAGFLDELTLGSIDVAVFLTGAGVRALADSADRLGRGVELWASLADLTIVCRGPKPVSALRRSGLRADLVASEPHTTVELLDAMADLDLRNVSVAVVHFGERNDRLTEALRARGGRLTELCLYEWRLPEDLGPLTDLVGQIIDGRLDAVAFTSQIQVRHLFQVAEGQNLSTELRAALNDQTIVASIGPTCTGVLEEHGVWPAVVPEHPKMGHLVLALTARLRQARTSWLGGVRAAH